MEKPFPAYTGDEPFVFVCYSHEDAAAVYPDLAWLHEQGVNIWYDEGIPAGENWRANIGRALLDASHVLVYLSRSSLLSDHCNREINLALDEAKVVVPVYVEPVELTPDLKVGLNRLQALRLEGDASHRTTLLKAIDQELSTTPSESPPARKSRRVLIASTLAAFVILAGLGSWFAYNDNDLPTDSRPAYNLYVRSFSTEDLLEKVELLEKALELDPSFLDARADLGYALVEAGESGVDQALPAFQRARDEALNVLASDPQHAWATVVLARTYLQLDLNAPKALDAFLEAVSLGASPSVVAIFKAAIYLNTGNYDAAESTMVAARDLNPGSASVVEFLARCLYLQGKVDAAWAMFDEAMKLNPRVWTANMFALASAAAEQDVVRLRTLIQRIPADARSPLYGEPLVAAIEGDHEPLRTMLAFHEENREQYKTFALRFTYGYWWIEDYENHIRWFEIREREYNNLYFVNFDIAMKPNYWEKLEAWSVADSEQVAHRQQLIRDHRSRIEQITSKMVL